MDFFASPPPAKNTLGPRVAGLSFIELLLVTIIVFIIVVMAIPSFISMLNRYRLVSTMEGMFYNLEYARSVAIKEDQTVYVTFQAGGNWCYGINSGSSCSCTTPSGCNLGTYTPPSQLTTLSLSGIGTLTFEGSRGAANSAGTITLTVTGGSQSMGIDVGTLGNITICSNTISGYAAC